MVCAGPDRDAVLVHPRDLFHPDATCAACAADHAELFGEDADTATGDDPSDMVFFARSEDGVLGHIDDWLAYYDTVADQRTADRPPGVTNRDPADGPNRTTDPRKEELRYGPNCTADVDNKP